MHFIFTECKCNTIGTKSGSNNCNKDNGFCNANNQPGCKRGYTGNYCKSCDSRSGYGTSGNTCDACIDEFFNSGHSDGRPNCTGICSFA